MNKNYKYYAYTGSSFLLFHIPILTIYFNEILKSVTLVSILFMVKSMTVLIFEIPTGYLADRYGRKISILIGMILNIMSLISFIYKPTIYMLVFGEICFGISECFLSGSIVALYYDNFKAEGREKNYSKFIKNIGLIQSIFLAISFFLGSILYGYSVKFVFICTIIFQCIAFFILLKINEHSYEKKINNKTLMKEKIKVFKNTLSKDGIFIVGIYGVVSAIFTGIYFQIFPILTSGMIESNLIYGAIYVLATITYGIGAKFGSGKIENFPKAVLVIIIGMSIVAITKKSELIIVLVILIRYVWGYLSTLLNLYINKNIKDSTFRSTIFSVLSMEVNMISAIVMILSGILMDYRIEIEQIFIIFSLILGGIFILMKRKVSNKS
ncbi:MAG: MFS transporter [Clostridium sp.]|uniref:MFS transporter n=1 Tax=Clostridium sp. TaxID=1506 RepID=UPI003F30AF06